MSLRSLSACGIFGLAVLTTACASSRGAIPRPFPTPDGRAAGPPATTSTPTPAAPSPGAPYPGGSARADATLIDTALNLRGVPYRNGGTDPNGFDCSGFTQFVFAQHGITLPRDVHDQFEVGTKIKPDDVKAGDLVFFHTVARGASHVGIVVADDQFVHAPSSTGVVRVEHLSSTYWSRRFIAARRVTPAELVTRPLPFPRDSRASRSAD
jgi:cell wall-associated NlpC family hydrolase